MSNVELKRAAEQDGMIKRHDAEAFAGMRKAGRIAAEALDMITEHVVPGVTTGEIDDLLLEFALNNKALPAPLFYRGFPRVTCTSINHVVCHGIPGVKKLQDGDIVNIDVTLIVDGWHGDTSRMYAVGELKPRAVRLLDVTYDCLMAGIAAVKPGATTGDIGVAIQAVAESNRCSVVRDFCGHGLGRVFHDRPNILHYCDEGPGSGAVLAPGMLFTIEPMINLGRDTVKVLADGWTAVTRDRELSAQFEHTIGVTESGCEIFTTSPAGLDKPYIRTS